MTAILTLIAAAASVIDHQCSSGDAPSIGPIAVDKKVGTVTHVIDGDTMEIVVEQGKPPVKVRLLGIDAPEAEGPARPLGLTSAAYTRARCEGKQVTLRLDELQREQDKYGRLLAYVYRVDDGTFVNLALAQEGYAQPLSIPPNVAYASQFAAASAAARRGGQGLWSACR